ncbi:site-specific integrase [Phenylobacterium sp.]|uniref:site-specific integrase n=1 Tax=Phenylobacterium sp. TaxID=1871053 RepID=UPI002F3EE4EA
MSEIDLGRYPGVYRRGSTWYVKKRVPMDLRHVENREQIAISLGTTDPREAERRYPFRLADIERRFHELRSELEAQGPVQAALRAGRLELLSDADIETLVGDWFRKRAVLREPSFDKLDARTHLHHLAEDESRIRAPDPHDMDPVENAANRLLLDAGMAARTRKLGRSRTKAAVPVVDRSTSQYAYLINLVRRALLADIAVSKDQLDGGQTATFDPLFNPEGGRAPHAPLTASTSAAIGRRTVADLVREYGRYREASYDKESTDRKYKLLFRALEETLGSDFAVAAIKASDCVRVKALLDALPPNISKRFRGFTLGEAAAVRKQKGLPAMAATTVGGYMQNLSAVFNWAEKQGDWGVHKNPAQGLTGSRRANVQRRSFTPDELKALFAALEPLRDATPTKFWVPALAVYTGARAGEICQLRTVDVIEVDGLHCLNLSEFGPDGTRVADKRLKTAASERIVPLHPAIVEAGFLRFVERQHNHERLFPDLKAGPKGNFSHEFSKWFGRFKRRVGFAQPSLVFHSFRHGFRDACRMADIGDETARALGGWSAINQATRYGNRGMVPVLDRAIKKLDFDGFKLPVALESALEA